MIAAGDFDAEENAAPADASTNDKSDQPTEEAVVKEEEKVSEVLQEAFEEKSKEVSDEEKKEEQEASASAGNELGSGEDDKYTKEDTPRRIFVKHIDRKKNADDIEDYFFDTYKDTGLEDVYTCTVYNARSQRRMFFGNVILTFDTEDNAKKFLEMKLKNEEKITWKRKLVRHTLAEVQKRREDRAASVVSNSGEGTNNAKGTAKVAKAGTPVRQQGAKPGVEEVKPSKIVACSNFPTAFNCNPEVERYLRECHENVREVRRQGNKVLVAFKDQRSAERFVGLAYVKYRGCYIGRSYHKEEVKQVERRAEKRKIETATNNSASAPPAASARPSTTPRIF